MHALVQLVVFRLTVTRTTAVEHGVVLLTTYALGSMNLCRAQEVVPYNCIICVNCVVW